MNSTKSVGQAHIHLMPWQVLRHSVVKLLDAHPLGSMHLLFRQFLPRLRRLIYCISLLLLLASCGWKSAKEPAESALKVDGFEISIEVCGTEEGAQASGVHNRYWGKYIDIVNSAASPLKDVYLSMEWMDSAGNKAKSERRFVGKWDVGERITFSRPFTAPEKVTITVESGGEKSDFVLYELPGPLKRDKLIPEKV